MTELQKKRALRMLCILMALVILICAAAPKASAKSTDEYYENAVLFWTNIERGRHGLGKLQTTADLNGAASTRATELSRYYSHTRPNGSRWSSVLSAYGIDYTSAAENIAVGQKTPTEVVSAGMNSSGHRDNILNSKYSYMGAGYAYVSGTKYVHHWEQLFTGGVTLSGGTGSFYVAPTGFTLDKSSLTLDVNASAQITGCPTPVYATAVISCTSSDTGVVKVTGMQVGTVSVKGVGNGTAALTFKCGGYSETVKVTVGTGAAKSPFYDVSPSSYYFEPVVWAVKNGIAAGYDDGSFRPNETCTKAHALTFLWRAEGSPDAGSTEPFTDVSPSAWYFKPVVWAYKNGIAGAESGTRFMPDKQCTRAELVTYIWRCEGSPAVKSNAGFTDISGLSTDAQTAINWAAANGITNGVSATQFGPNMTVTRGQAVTFLYRNYN